MTRPTALGTSGKIRKATKAQHARFGRNDLPRTSSRFGSLMLAHCIAIHILFGSAALAALVSESIGAEISFRPRATVSSNVVLLKDVAVVKAGDPAIAAQLENVVLSPAPAPGRHERLEFATIASRLAAIGVATADLNYTGSSVIEVVSARQAAPLKAKSTFSARTAVSPAQMRRAEQVMTEAIRRSLRMKHRDANSLFLEVMIEPADVAAVFAGAAGGFDIGAIDPRVTDAQAIKVQCQDAHGRTLVFQVQCIVSERPRVPVLTRSISSGETIHESDLTWKQVDATAGLIARIEDIVDKEAKKSLHADEPLHAGDVRTVPLVRSNDIVTGIWKSGSIRITGQFKAKSDGGLGDIITLVKLTGRDQVLGRVTDLHEAEIVSADSTSSRRRAIGGELDAGDDGRSPLTFQGTFRGRMSRSPETLQRLRQTELVGGN